MVKLEKGSKAEVHEPCQRKPGQKNAGQKNAGHPNLIAGHLIIFAVQSFQKPQEACCPGGIDELWTGFRPTEIQCSGFHSTSRQAGSL